MSEMPQEFAFTDGDRTFTCRVEASRAARTDAWWWFDVSTERHQRHAPFRAAAGDTLHDVATRVVAYYDDLLARRAAPPVTRWQRRPVGAAAEVAATPGADPVVPAS
ncbi:hypothetical protein tb265_09400 [Gemmatimonadetes bacterium T265]|nr:hypothetical protein tb265_09400 [Gemmatimonadetes bacterium T265]